MSNSKYHLNRRIFLDGSVDIARYDVLKYPQFDKLTQKQLGFFWRPEEVDVSKDSKDFRAKLDDSGRHIITSVLSRQIVLDTKQGASPSLAFLPICSLPEIETLIQTWAFSETIHSRSYTHIIRNLYSDPAKVFDEILNIPEVAECDRDISKYYDDLIEYNALYLLKDPSYSEYQHKKLIWLALNSVNALEGIRFYASFAAAWNFAEQKLMEGNAKIVKLIARDENLHLAITQQILKILPRDDPDFVQIKKECEPEVFDMFEKVILQEKKWAAYLFKFGSMIGLNERLLCDYIDWVAAKRMQAVGIPVKKIGANPLPWTQKWIAGSEIQVAPQEVEKSSYIIGGIKMDVQPGQFKEIKL